MVNEELFVFKLLKKNVLFALLERERKKKRESESGGGGQRRALCVQAF